MARYFAVWLLALLALAAPAAAQNFPELTGRVVDQADLLRPEQEFDLKSKSEALEASTPNQGRAHAERTAGDKWDGRKTREDIFRAKLAAPAFLPREAKRSGEGDRR